MKQVIRFIVFSTLSLFSFSTFAKTIVAIDAGHGEKIRGLLVKIWGFWKKALPSQFLKS